MPVVKINAITVPDGAGPELERRFAARKGDVDSMPGFISFQLLRPTSGEDRYFVVTQWETEEHFNVWTTSQQFRHAHNQAGPPSRPVAPKASLLGFDVVLETRTPAATR